MFLVMVTQHDQFGSTLSMRIPFASSKFIQYLLDMIMFSFHSSKIVRLLEINHLGIITTGRHEI